MALSFWVGRVTDKLTDIVVEPQQRSRELWHMVRALAQHKDRWIILKKVLIDTFIALHDNPYP